MAQEDWGFRVAVFRVPLEGIEGLEFRILLGVRLGS